MGDNFNYLIDKSYLPWTICKNWKKDASYFSFQLFGMETQKK